MVCKRVSQCFLFIIILSAGLNGLIASVQAQEPTPETIPAVDPRFGVVNSFVNSAEASAAGVGWTRIFFRWDVVQPGGPSDWKPTNVPDTFIDAEIEAGREVVAVLIGTPAWASDSGASTAVSPQEFWGDFVFKIASQYQGRIKHWIIWHQPDLDNPTSINHTWDGTEEEYLNLLREAYLKIKAVDPSMQVHVAGLTYTWDRERGQPQYLARLLDLISADPQAANEGYYFDAVSYHLYYDPRQILEITTDVRRILDAKGLANKAIWINEINAPPSEDFLEPRQSPAPYSVTLEEQSAFVIQAFALGLAGGAERIAFNEMRNEPGAAELTGLLRGDNSRRPAFNAFQTVTTYFAGGQDIDLQKLNDVYVVTLDRAGQTTTVLWNLAPAPLNFSLNAIAPTAVLVDDQGNQQTITATNGQYAIDLPGAICSNGSNCFIGGAPRLVVETGSANQRTALSAPILQQATLTAPVAAATPTASPLEPTIAPPPTLTPTPGAGVDNISTSNPPAQENTTNTVPPTPADDGNSLAGPAALPDPGLDQSDAVVATDQTATPALTEIPPVSFRTVMTPQRLLWLFLIGLVVFTISYGVQVVIWYRIKR